LLPKIVGMAKAQELLMTARTVTAREAADMGLVNYAVPADKLMTKARELALQCAECSAVTQKYAKRALHYGASVSLEEAFAHEQRAVELLRAEQQRG
jgi:enoyl-CoA hydratase/carnithine racemase